LSLLLGPSIICSRSQSAAKLLKIVNANGLKMQPHKERLNGSLTEM